MMFARYTQASIEEALSEAVRKLSFHEFKPKQKEAVLSFVSGRDTFVALPTGYGKSAIYAVLPFVFDYILGK